MVVETKRRARRRDALPENFDYHDDGCEVAPACLSCPLPVCRFDVVGGARTLLNLDRDAHIKRLYGEGWAVEAIAVAVNVSRRTVTRAVHKRGAIVRATNV